MRLRIVCGALLAMLATLPWSAAGAEPPDVLHDALGDPLPPGAFARFGTERYWHGGDAIQALAFSADNQMLASAVTIEDRYRFTRDDDDVPRHDPSMEIHLWAPRTGKLIRKLVQAEPVSALAFAPRGLTLAAGSGVAICLWDAGSGQKLREWVAHPKPILRLAFSPDGLRLASADQDGLVCVWDAETGQELRAVGSHPGGVTTLSFSPDGKRLATAGRDNRQRQHQVYVWDLASGAQSHKLDLGTFEACAAFNPTTGALAFPAQKQSEQLGAPLVIRTRDLETGAESGDLQVVRHERAVNMSYTSDARRLAVQLSRQGLLVFDVRTGAQLMSVQGGGSLREQPYALSADGQLVATGAGGRVHVWDVNTGTDLLAEVGAATDSLQTSFTPDGRLLAVTDQRQIKLWDVASRRDALVIPTTEDGWQGQQSLRFSTDGRLLYLGVGSFHNKYCFWEAASGQLVRQLDNRQYREALCLNAQGTKLIGVDRMGNVAMCELDQGQPIKAWQIPNRPQEVVFSPCGDVMLAEDLRAGEVRAYNAESGQHLWTQADERLTFRHPLFTKDGTRFIRPGPKGAAGLYDVQTNKLVQTLPIAAGSQLTDLSNGERRAVTIDSDRNVSIWDLPEGKEVLRLSAAEGKFSSGRISPDGSTLVTHGAAQSVLVWDVARVISRSQPIPPRPIPVRLGSQATLLHRAANRGDLPAVQSLLKDGADVNDEDFESGTALHLAATQGHVDIVRELLKHRADATIKRKLDHAAPLDVAVAFGRVDVVRAMLDAGVIPAWPDRKWLDRLEGTTGQVEAMRVLIERGMPVPEDLGQPPLSPESRKDIKQVLARLRQLDEASREIASAVAVGNTTKVKDFLALQPSLVARRTGRRSLLGVAVAEGNVELVRMLLAAGAELEGRNALPKSFGGDGTPLDLAIVYGQYALVDLLLQAGAQAEHDRPGMRETGLQLAAETGDARLVERFLALGLDPNGTGSIHGGPLHAAIRSAPLEIVKRLLERGADPNRTDHWDSALHVAAQAGSAAVVKLLLAHDADLKRPGVYRRTLVQSAAFRGRQDIVDVLAESGLPIDLFSAAALGDLELAKKLVEADPRTVSEKLVDGRTPLHVAAAHGQEALAAFLLDRGANPNAEDNEFTTPLDKAQPAERALERLLKARGGKVTFPEERAQRLAEQRDTPAPLYGPPIRCAGMYLYPAGQFHVATDRVYSLVENVAGRRVVRVEIEEDGWRINLTLEPDREPSVIVASLRANRGPPVRYESWETFRQRTADAARLYDKYAQSIETDTLEGQTTFIGGWGQIGALPLWPMLGVRLEHEKKDGRLAEVAPGSPAEQAGLRVGDIVTRIGGSAIDGHAGLARVVARYEVGQRIRVEARRGDETLDVEATLAARPANHTVITVRDGGRLEDSAR